MIVEIHILQNFVPSNLNRDDTGSPKDCQFGGHRRARISSQCQKRAMRQHVSKEQLLDTEDLGHRTKRLLDALKERLKSRDAEEVEAVVRRLLGGKKITIKDDNDKTEYLMFLGEREIAGLAAVVEKHWDELATPAEAKSVDGGKKKSAKERKKEAAQGVSSEISKAVEAVLNGGKAADVAMFGRMLADLPDNNVDAACQVAHAISVNKADIEFDYYTAVDDLKPGDTAGADMIGTVELTSACFYRYMAIHGGQLLKNLQGDEQLAEKSIMAFLRAAVEAVPSGKQNSTAAHNPPSFVMVVVRPSGCVNLANAFVQPIRATEKVDLVTGAVKALDGYWKRTSTMYPSSKATVAYATSCDEDASTNLNGSRKASIDEVYATVAAAIRGKLKENGR